MAQTGFTPLQIYSSPTTTNVPLAANLVAGELAINTADGKLFYKDSSNVVQVLATKGGVGSSTTTQVLYNSSGLVVGSANLTFDGTKLTVGNILNSGLTASQAIFTDASKNLVSNVITGTGNVVMSTSPTLSGTVAGAYTLGGTPTINAVTLAGTVSGGGNQINNVVIGASTPLAGNFTTVGASGAVTLSGGTANGVAYLNGSNVLTTGSALTFDGNNLGLGVTPSAWNTYGKAIQIGTLGAISEQFFATNNDQVSVSSNAYRTTDTNWRYLNSTNKATAFIQMEGDYRWLTAPSGTAGNPITFTQAMTLDASGNLGIGTSSPDTKLHVSANNVTLHLEDPRTTGDGSHTVGIAAYKAGVGYDSLTYDAYTHQFKIVGTERARIDSGGNLLVGTTTHVNGAQNNNSFDFSPSLQAAVFNHVSGTPSTYTYVNFGYNTSIIGSVAQLGTTGVLYNTSSDYRLKANQQPLTEAGNFIDALKPTTWTWTSDGRKDAGFIAHEFQKVCPNAVTGVKDEVDADGKPKYQAMQASSSEVIANLVAELQSLRKRIAILENK